MGSWVKKSSVLFVAAACGGAPTHTPPPGVSTVDLNAGAPPYEFASLDPQHPVSSGAFLGKATLLAFVTTYDPISQFQVNILVPLAASMPDAQFALVALQDASDPSARELVGLYRDTMKVTFPVALADQATIAGGGTLGDVHQVPTVVLLSPDGRIAWRHSGPVRTDELRKRLTRLAR